MRLDKFLSNLKYGSRKEIKSLLKDRLVLVNGRRITSTDFKIDPSVDEICIDGTKVFYKESITLMLHKPSGYVSANKDSLHKTVFELIKDPYNRFDLNIAGRLDIDTEGLLILTNNGAVIHRLIHPSKDVYKKYFVRVNHEMDCRLLLQEMEILDGNNNPYVPALPIVEQIDQTTFYLSIKEGKFHQVKRMCEYLGVQVTYLKRVAIGDIVLDESLPLGGYKEI